MENQKSGDQKTLLKRMLFAGLMLVIAAAIAAYALLSTGRVPSGSGTPLVGGPFSMVDHTGRNVTEKTYAGKPMLLFFGFTYCPDVCPTELQVMAAALEQLGNKGAEIQPIFVSIDPARDTPDVLKAYVENFGPSFIGLTGTPEQVAAMAQTYKVFFEKRENKEAPDNYLMDHSSIIYLMGRDGKYLRHFSYTTDAAKLVEGLVEALKL
jgi:cytochrome oxidase Cu insertion factor (SCO1/SenC/PrrC family)